ncbi:hypothetical protein MGSAQ_002572, partial [marine sediment metagenome]
MRTALQDKGMTICNLDRKSRKKTAKYDRPQARGKGRDYKEIM